MVLETNRLAATTEQEKNNRNVAASFPGRLEAQNREVLRELGQSSLADLQLRRDLSTIRNFASQHRGSALLQPNNEIIGLN